MPYRLNDTSAAIQVAGSGFLAGATWVTDLAEWMQIGATAVAIIAGLMAAWYHYERAKAVHESRKRKEDK